MFSKGLNAGNNWYMIFMEYTFKPSKDISYDQWANSQRSGFYMGMALGMDNKVANNFGYHIPSTENSGYLTKNTFLKTDKENRFWGMNEVANKKGDFWGSSDGGGSFSYIIK